MKLPLITALCILHQTLPIKSQSIPIVTLQGNGSFSRSTYIDRKGPFGPEEIFSQLSICLRMTVFYLRGRQTYFLSYANNESADALTGYIERTAFDKTYILAFCKHKFMNYACVEHEFKTFEFYNWHHVCLTYVHETFGDGSNRVSMELFVDGTLEQKAEKVISAEADFLPLKTDGILVLGQEQDSLGGFFDENQAFSGELSQVELWTTQLDSATIAALANCQQETALVQSRVVAWNRTLDEWSIQNVEKTSMELSSLCQPRILQDYLIWAEPVTYQQISDYCRRLDGVLPIIDEKTSLKEVHDLALEKFVNTEPENPFAECAAGDNLVKFWIREPNVTMRTDLSKHTCPYVFGDRIEMQPCTVKFPCGICKLPAAKRLLIKGVCGKDAEYSYDFDFGVYGTQDAKALFRGSQNSIMRYHKGTKKWRLQSLRNPLNMIQTVAELDEDLPIGTHVWEVTNDFAICKLRQNQTLELTISQCYPDKYTCNNGDCIALADKCNTEIDCVDKSDEYYCEYLRFGENYAKELVPRDETGSPLIVYMNVSVLAFPFIETINLKFTADYFLNLKWYDLRIDYQDLNNVTSLNSLSHLDKNKIWTPKLGFTNALGPFQTEVDDLTTGVLVREGDPLQEDITLSTEAGLFSGRENAIYLTREYYQEYACRFDLIFYPFDTQLCFMTFEVQGKTDDYIQLAKDSSPGIEFLSSRKLVEYEIQMEALEFRSVNNVSQGIVKFVFRRNMEFHVTNTFLQTFLLTCVGYFSYYFDVDNFSDRIMVVLTTMLVVATITTSIQDSLPKTSYYKMIDWWLLVSLNILVITMAFHTFLAHVVSKCTKKPMRLLSAKSYFNTRYNNSVVATGPGITNVESKIQHEENEYNRAKTSMSIRAKTEMTNYDPSNAWSNPEGDILAAARRWNHIGKIVYVVLYILFNIVFWATAISEYVRPAEQYINNDKLTL